MGSKEKRVKAVTDAGRTKFVKSGKRKTGMDNAAGQGAVRTKGNRRTGIILLAAGLLLAAFGLYLFSRTWGLNLLFTSVWIGRLSRFYGIVLLAGAGAVLLGVLSLKKGRAAQPEAAAAEPTAPEAVEPETAAAEPAQWEPAEAEAAAQESEEPVGAEPMEPQEPAPAMADREKAEEKQPLPNTDAGERFCPVCGNRLSARSRFCGKCGTKVE